MPATPPATSVVRARIGSDLKSRGRIAFRAMGLTESDAIRLFFVHVTEHNALPFPIRVPNAVTRATMEATDAGKDLIRAKDAKDLFRQLGI